VLSSDWQKSPNYPPPRGAVPLRVETKRPNDRPAHSCIDPDALCYGPNPLHNEVVTEDCCIGYLAHPFKKRRTWPARSLLSLGTELD
jgi:hypothetical protein